jgi:hypothetical protein
MITSKQVRKTLVKGILTTTAAGLFALGLGVSTASAQKVESCRSFNTGRTTCSYRVGGGGTVWNSYNSDTGYSSNGYRNNSGGSSYGSYDWNNGRKSGTRSYSSWGSVWP